MIFYEGKKKKKRQSQNLQMPKAIMMCQIWRESTQYSSDTSVWRFTKKKRDSRARFKPKINFKTKRKRKISNFVIAIRMIFVWMQVLLLNALLHPSFTQSQIDRIIFFYIYATMISSAYLIFNIIANYRLRCIISNEYVERVQDGENEMKIKMRSARYYSCATIIPAYFQNNERVAIRTPTQ